MDGRGSRDKGRRGERELVAYMIEHGYAAEKLSRSGYTGPDVFTLGRYCEVKRREEEVPIKPYRWLDDASILFMRRNRMPWLACMELDTLFDLGDEAPWAKAVLLD